MTTPHTPGPWRIVFVRGGVDMRVMTGAPNSLSMDVNASGSTTEESLANARLVAAAPDLLAALRDLAEAVDEQTRRDGEGYCPHCTLRPDAEGHHPECVVGCARIALEQVR